MSISRFVKPIRQLTILCLTVLSVGYVAAATVYPPSTGENSTVQDGVVKLRPAANATTIASVTVTLGRAPMSVQSTSQVIDGDTLDLLVVFRTEGDFPGGQVFVGEYSLGVLPAAVKTVRLLTKTISETEKPVVQQSTTQVSEQCVTLHPSVNLTVGAYETIRVPVQAGVGAAPIRPLRVETSPTTIDVYVDTGLPSDVCPDSASGPTQTVEFNVTGKPVRPYRLRLLHHTGKLAAFAPLSMSQRGQLTLVNSLESRTRGSYFVTTSPADVTTLLALRGPNQDVLWTIADEGFQAWPATGVAPSTAVNVCRFFNQRVSTHFYSARVEDCNALRGVADWTDEGIAFRILLPQNGACQEFTTPVYRLFSSALSNHRYTADVSAYTTLINAGWVGEGIAFCSPTL